MLLLRKPYVKSLLCDYIEDLTWVHVLLNLFDVLGKKIRREAVLSILSVFPTKFNKFNNTEARMQDSVHHMTLKSHFISDFSTKTSKLSPLEIATFLWTSVHNIAM